MADSFQTSPFSKLLGAPSNDQSVLNPPATIGALGSIVWMGHSEIYGDGSGPHAKASKLYYKPVADAYNHFLHLSDPAVEHLNAVYAAMNGGKLPSFTQQQQLWHEMVDAAAYDLKIGKAVSPLNALDDKAVAMARMNAAAGGAGGATKVTGQTQTSVQTTITNKTDARAIADAALHQYLGRAATDSEQAAFYKSLVAKEKAAPQTSVTESAIGGSASHPNVKSNTTTTGGTNANQLGAEWGQAHEGSGEYAASTTYLDAFLGSLSNPTPIAGT